MDSVRLQTLANLIGRNVIANEGDVHFNSGLNWLGYFTGHWWGEGYWVRVTPENVGDTSP